MQSLLMPLMDDNDNIIQTLYANKAVWKLIGVNFISLNGFDPQKHRIWSKFWINFWNQQNYQDAPESPRYPQDAPESPKMPQNPLRCPRIPQITLGCPRFPQEAPETPKMPQYLPDSPRFPLINTYIWSLNGILFIYLKIIRHLIYL